MIADLAIGIEESGESQEKIPLFGDFSPYIRGFVDPLYPILSLVFLQKMRRREELTLTSLLSPLQLKRKARFLSSSRSRMTIRASTYKTSQFLLNLWSPGGMFMLQKIDITSPIPVF